MGSQSCVVVTGFICIHVAFIVNMVAVTTTYWVTGYAQNYTNINTTGLDLNDSRKGLWKLCDEHGCEDLTGDQQGTWFRIVQVLHTLGAIFSFLALIAYYAFFMYSNRHTQTYCMTILIMAISTISCICVVLAISFFGKWGEGYSDELYPPVQFGWSFYTAIGGAVFIFVTSVLVMREGWLLKNEEMPYMDL